MQRRFRLARVLVLTVACAIVMGQTAEGRIFRGLAARRAMRRAEHWGAVVTQPTRPQGTVTVVQPRESVRSGSEWTSGQSRGTPPVYVEPRSEPSVTVRPGGVVTPSIRLEPTLPRIVIDGGSSTGSSPFGELPSLEVRRWQQAWDRERQAEVDRQRRADLERQQQALERLRTQAEESLRWWRQEADRQQQRIGQLRTQQDWQRMLNPMYREPVMRTPTYTPPPTYNPPVMPRFTPPSTPSFNMPSFSMPRF